MEGDYLRIVTPRIDRFGGPWYVDGVLQVTEIEAPLTARKGFEEENRRLAGAGRPELQHRITVVSAAPLQTYSRPIAPALEDDIKPVRKPQQKKSAGDDIFE